MFVTITASKEVMRLPASMKGVRYADVARQDPRRCRPAGTRQATRRLNALLGAHSRLRRSMSLPARRISRSRPMQATWPRWRTATDRVETQSDAQTNWLRTA